MYITHTDDHRDHVMRSIPPSEEVERWAIKGKHIRLQHRRDSDHEDILHKKLRQKQQVIMMRSITPSSPEQEQEQSFSYNHDNEQIVTIKNNQMTILNQSDNVQNDQRETIKNNQIVNVQTKATVHHPTTRQLFISDGPVVVKDFLSWKKAGETHSFTEQQESKNGFARHAFNQYASDRLGYFRDVPDARHTL